jgi:hypothetical protein
VSYTVIKTINGRRYRYQQETYRQNGKVRTRSVYLGPVDGERRKGRITEFLQELVRKDENRNFETEEQAKVRVAAEDKERAKQAHINELLTAPMISLDAINEIAAARAAETEDTGKEKGGEKEGEPVGSP